MKILIFGASGSGTTTLGKEMAKITGFVHLDADDYYWKPTEPPFTEKVSFDERNEKIKNDFLSNENVIISGSMVSWGKEWETSFDLAVFIHLDNEIRMERLKKREFERYGGELQINKAIQLNHQAFMEWASQYENPDFEGRSLKVHNDWIKKLHCKVLRMDGELELNDKVAKLIIEIQDYRQS
ncbi:MAG: AAA family ATPase [Microscillaceae bacterium]|jgi:adenylate kinase family enzyme|nr:AAA family ATPase [Microscillaceae bacterium]